MLFEKFQRFLGERPEDVGWKEGEEWIRSRGADFDREAEALDPAKERT
jgi:hypothetical protein